MNTQFDIPEPLVNALIEVSQRLHKTKSEILIQALKEYLEDQEDLLAAEEAFEEWMKSGEKTYSFEEIMEECGLSEKDFRTLKFTLEAQKAFKKLDPSTQKEIFKFFKTKVLTTQNVFAFAKPLRHHLFSFYRYRIGDYRVICAFKENELIITIFKVGHRREIYG